ncbi:unnamed protein product [Penicillium camemberti]|uniref:Str. FM013 n=1 Tax=Penicillium camemberti (strain FM 013) TaxID=1429867 RepID=A0A0G4PK21_PENC3|nr:unnamed protein product [Penicillium camemberti]
MDESKTESVVATPHQTTLQSLVSQLDLTREEAEALVEFLPQIIIEFVEDRWATLEVPWDLWA